MGSPSSSTSSSYPVSLPSSAELLLSIGSPSIHPLSLQSNSSPGGTSHGPYDGLNVVRGYDMMRKNVRARGAPQAFKLGKHAKTIRVLSDDVLLEIFGFYRREYVDKFRLAIPRRSWAHKWTWHVLAHVCHRWRQILFASPIRLNLEIVCTVLTPVRNRLDIWPTFPIAIIYDGVDSTNEDDMIAALEHPSRVCEIVVHGVQGPQLGSIATAMQEPFPALRCLLLTSSDCNLPVLPSEFLGRSAPRLQKLSFFGIPFPALPILLPSASNLVALYLNYIPQNGYISPEAMVAGLATLTRLRNLSIVFRS